jgi:hypothetical protein
MGSELITVKNLKIVDVKAEQNYFGCSSWIKGTYLEIRKEN